MPSNLSEILIWIYQLFLHYIHWITSGFQDLPCINVSLAKTCKFNIISLKHYQEHDSIGVILPSAEQVCRIPWSILTANVWPKGGGFSLLLSQQQSFKKQFRNTRSSCPSRHSFLCLPWRKGTWDGRDNTISSLPEHPAQKGTEVLCCNSSWAETNGSAANITQKFSHTWEELRSQHKPQSTGKEDKRNALFTSVYWMTLFCI